MKKQIKKIVSISVAMLMIFSITACVTKKKDAASGVKEEMESTEEMKIILEVLSKETNVKDKNGKEVKLKKGIKLGVIEKTTDDEGKIVYILEEGDVIKERTEEMAKLNEGEAKIILEMYHKGATIINTNGNDITQEDEYEELVVQEKTTDEEGKTVYFLEDGLVIKERVVSMEQ